MKIPSSDGHGTIQSPMNVYTRQKVLCGEYTVDFLDALDDNEHSDTNAQMLLGCYHLMPVRPVSFIVTTSIAFKSQVSPPSIP